MMKWFKENTISSKQAEKMDEHELMSKIVVGVFGKKQRPTLTETVQAAMEEAKKTVED
jgi:hypothetical protein